MNTLDKKIKSIFLVTFLLFCGIANLYSQDQMIQDEPLQEDTSRSQDNIFNDITDIREVWNKRQTNYFVNTDPKQELRFYSITLDGRHRYYKDILLDPIYEHGNYPVTYNDTLVWDLMFIPIVFSGKIFVGDYIKVPNIVQSLTNKYSRLDLSKVLNPPKIDLSDAQKQFRQKVYLNTILADPTTVKYFPEDLAAHAVVKPEALKVDVLKDLFSVENNPDFASAETPVKYATKRKYWIVHGSHQFQISEIYVSDNWYKGGASSANIISIQKVNFNYKKGKVSNNNEVKWELNMYYNPDVKPKTQIGNDLLRTFSDFGLAASDKWSYSMNLEMKTQVLDNKKENTNIKKAAFMSPFFMSVGLPGMKYQTIKTYKTNKDKNVSIIVDISPLSFKYAFMADPDGVSHSGTGIPAAKSDTLIVGSLLNSTFKIKFNKGVVFSSRFKCFTDYQRVEIESENELNMAINRYFSTRIFFYARYDDAKGIAKDPKLGYWQINQVLSFGLSYNW